MSLIKNNQFKSVNVAPGKVTTKPVEKSKVEAPKSKEVTQAPSESFVSTAATSPKSEVVAPRDESPKTETESKPKQLRKPREGSDMAAMLENMEAAKLAGGDLKSNSNGTLFVTQDGLISMGDPEKQQTETKSPMEQMLSQMHSETSVKGGKTEEHGKTEGHGDHGHGHGPHTGHDAAMGGHLGTEVVEKVGHHASHGAGHVAEAAGQVKGHGAAEVVSHAKGHGAAEVVSQAKGHAAGTVGHAKSQGAHHASEVLGDAAQATQSGHALSEAHEVTSEAAKHGTEAAGHLSTGLATALGTSAALSGGIGAYMLYEGGKELSHGVKEKDGEKIAEGVGGLAVGARSVAAGTVMASMATGGAGVLADVASVASQTLTPLGVVHGAVDVGLGVKDLVKGDKVDGLIKLGFGSTIIAGAIVGGIPLTVAAIGMLGVKVGRGVYKNRQAKKAAQQAEAQSQQTTQQPDSHKDVKT